MMRLAPNISASTPDAQPASAAISPYMVNISDDCEELNPWSTMYLDKKVNSKPSPVMNTAMATKPANSVRGKPIFITCLFSWWNVVVTVSTFFVDKHIFNAEKW